MIRGRRYFGAAFARSGGSRSGSRGSTRRGGTAIVGIVQFACRVLVLFFLCFCRCLFVLGLSSKSASSYKALFRYKADTGPSPSPTPLAVVVVVSLVVMLARMIPGVTVTNVEAGSGWSIRETKRTNPARQQLPTTKEDPNKLELHKEREMVLPVAEHHNETLSSSSISHGANKKGVLCRDGTGAKFLGAIVSISG